MTTSLIVACFVGLQACFVWARYKVFRVDGPTPGGVRVIEASTLVCMAVGSGFIIKRNTGHVVLDVVALATAGVSAAVFGWALHGIHRLQLSAAFSPDRPTELVQRGAFGVVRNPFYLAYLLAYWVPLEASRSVWTVLPLVWMTMLYRRAVAMEEQKFLASPLAADWCSYAQVTGRFLPHLPLRRRHRESPT